MLFTTPLEELCNYMQSLRRNIRVRQCATKSLVVQSLAIRRRQYRLEPQHKGLALGRKQVCYLHDHGSSEDVRDRAVTCIQNILISKSRMQLLV